MNKIAVLGAGAMGGLFGGLLSEAGYAVALIDVDEAHLAAIAEHGLRLTTDAADRRVRVEAGRADAFRGEVDLLLVFTKAHHTAEALESARHLIGTGTWALTLQNGLDAGERIERRVPRERIAIGMTNWPAELAGPGHVVSHGAGEVRLWSLSGKGNPALAGIADALTRAHLACTLDPNVATAIWEKASFNAAMNAIAAVSGMRVGQMADSADIRSIAADVVREGAAAARAAGIEVDERRIRAAMEHAYADHRDHRPSMLQDLEAGRRTEIDAINGAIAAHAERLGIAVPVIATLARLVRGMESARR